MEKRPDFMVPEAGTVDALRADRREWGELVANSPRLTKLIEDHEPDYRPFASLLQDAGMGLYYPNPQFLPPEQIRPSLRFNREILAQAMTLPEWQNIREWSQDDLAASALGGVHLSPKLVDLIPPDAVRAARDAEAAEKAA
ncbi:hypothetical protein GTO91_17050, partial [Heliobacterium undosum]